MSYYDYISGGMTPQHFAAALTISFLAWSFYKTISGLMRDRGSQRTPAKFNLKFWWKDNFREAWQHALIMFVLVRFASEIVARTVPNSASWLDSNDPMWIYFVVGFAKAYILKVLKRKKDMKQ